MEHSIVIVGIGPGHPDYLLPAAIRAVEQADFLAGGPRALELFAHLNKETMVIDGKLGDVLEFIREKRKQGRVAVLVSGDPGFHSLLSYLSKHFTRAELEVVPGISSLQVACARLKVPWQNAGLMSLHGRPLEDIGPLLGNYPVVGLLTDPRVAPAGLGETMLDHGLTGSKIYICENLSYPEERITEYSPEGLKDIKAFNNSVVVIINDL